MTPQSPDADLGTWTATEKTLLVLEAALSHGRLTEVARATGLAKSTVHRIATALIDRGFVVIGEDGDYLPGPKALVLAGKALERIDISVLVEPQIQELLDATRCTIHIGALSGDEVVYLARRDSDKPYRMPSRVGKSIWMHSSGMGKALLAAMPEGQCELLVKRSGLPSRTPNTINRLPALRNELSTVRKRGFAIDDEENEPGIRCVAAAIRDHTGRANYAVSAATLSLEHSVSDLETMAPHVMRAARQMSRALGNARDESEMAVTEHGRGHHDGA